jgi:putative transposase
MVHRSSYSSDLNDREWQILEPLLPAEKPGGRHRAYPMREVINAIQYLWLCCKSQRAENKLLN